MEGYISVRELCAFLWLRDGAFITFMHLLLPMKKNVEKEYRTTASFRKGN